MTTDDERDQASTGAAGSMPPGAPPAGSVPPAAAGLGPPRGGVGPAAPAPANPSGVYPAVYETPPDPTAAPTAKPRKRGRAAAVVTGAIVVVGAVVLKVAIPILVGTAVGGALTGVFGGPFEKLPADQKQALERRFEAATGDALNGISEAERSARVDAMLTSGLPRLGDDLLIERIHISAAMLNAADVATCARIARATATRGYDEDAMRTALDAIDTASAGRWFEIAVSAIEADAAGATRRTVAKADSDRVLADLVARFSETEVQQITALYNDTGATDVDACGAVRGMYGHIEELPAADLAIAALDDASP